MPKSTASRSEESNRQEVWNLLLGPERKRILSVPTFLLGAELYNNPFKLQAVLNTEAAYDMYSKKD